MPGPASETETDARTRVRAKFEELRGFWDPLWDSVLDADPELLDAYIDLSSVPWQHGSLDPKERELIYVAMNASTTHLYHIGVRVHLRNAIGYGATMAEAMAVLAIVSELGSHTMDSVLPMLANQLAESGEQPGQLAPEYATALARYKEVTRSRGVLSPKFTHLVSLACAASATHLHLPAVEKELGAALAAGVEWEQIVEVLEIVAMVGVHTLTECAPILAEEFSVGHVNAASRS